MLDYLQYSCMLKKKKIVLYFPGKTVTNAGQAKSVLSEEETTGSGQAYGKDLDHISQQVVLMGFSLG
jgi:hypothetical protein